MGQSQKGKKQYANFMMIIRDITKAGYHKRDPGGPHAQCEYSVGVLEPTCTAETRRDGLKKQPKEAAEPQQSGLSEQFDIHVVGVRYMTNLKHPAAFKLRQTLSEPTTPISRA